jgi:hypothetical protein
MGKLRLGLSVIASLLAAGCGGGADGSGTYAMRPPDDGNDPGGSLDADAGAQDEAAPIVTILEPLPTADPNVGVVLTTSAVTARCSVSMSEVQGARDVDQSSVKMQVVGEGEDAIPITAAVDAVSDHEFEAHLDFPDLPNGRLRFGCTAQDLGSTPLLGWDDVDTFLDLGPTIEMVEPLDASIHALKAPVAITFKVESAPLSSDDREADIDSIQVDVSGQEFEAIESEEQPGFYSVLVDFEDRTRFPMAPSTAQIVVSATNKRTPVAGERRKAVNIMLDSDGPTITVVSPENFTLVRGDVTFAMTITDPSGVASDSVVASINDGLFELSNWAVMGTSYSERFDTRIPETEEKTQLSINIRARDNVGNEKIVSHTLLLDNVPPLVSLDPPPVREWKDSGAMILCSAPFDPLGDAKSDGESSEIATLYRVAVMDLANQTPGNPIIHLAGVDENSIKLYMQTPDKPLLVDTNADGTCDDVLTDVPEADQPYVNDDFKALAPSGASYFAPMGPANPDPAPGPCHYGTDMMPPVSLCSGTADLTRIISQDVEGALPAVYAWNAQGTAAGCAGNYWDAGDFHEGWVCVVARAEDNIGNVGVSPPIRVCYGSCDMNDIPDCLGTEDAPCDSPPDWPSGLLLKVR